ncbi:MAG: alkaline phosphatase family protein [Chroococcidiopsidaceae cyanobacterium CP_BM_ER_R8_30]|nr:alkaline phosphatase family protein [Chroococcidiopsidaceae cyanobacterium CP_BM_ER_R8_30]
MHNQVESRSNRYRFARCLSSRQFIKALRRIWQSAIAHFIKRFSPIVLAVFFLAIGIHSVTAQSTPNTARPKTILISLDGATPRFVDQYLANGVLSPDRGLGLLKSQGISAQQNITCTPSLTAACHIAIGTGSTTANTDIDANSFELLVSPLGRTISGFSAPIGGYSINGPAPSPNPTAEPIWIPLRANGKKVVTATFPGGDGLDVTAPGLSNSPIIQPASQRTVDYTVPFGAFAGVSAKGFSLTAANFSPAPGTTTSQLNVLPEAAPAAALSKLDAAGKVSYSPVLQASLNDTFTVGGVKYDIRVAALDTTNDSVSNYDTLVFFDANQGIKPGPFSLPSTGPAYVRASDQTSSPFYLEGSSNRAGTAFYVSNLAPDLSTVRVLRYSANYIPRNPAVLANVDDINNNVGFWADQADYRLTERLDPSFNAFPDAELEAAFEDQVRSFVDYQTRVALRAINQVPNADLVMVYIEQPDGSEHQFLLTDQRQATNPADPNTIGAGQDQAKIARYQKYLQTAYQAADNAVQRIIDAVGTNSEGKPNSNIFVVSDHGFTTFHTSVDIITLLKNNGIDTSKVQAVTSGPAANIYINLQGREPNGNVSPQEYAKLQQQIAQALKAATDTNPNYTKDNGGRVPLFDKVYSRPLPVDPGSSPIGTTTSDVIGQDAGDVLALLTEGYNFDGAQSPPVQRLGDSPSTNQVLSVSSFYGAHGYDATIPNMSAILYAAGPDIGRGTLTQIRNIDVAPTITQLLGVQSAPTVQGKPFNLEG